MKLVVGLGNPGNEYSKTRHNIGFQLLDYIANRNNIEFKSDKKFNAECATYMLNGEKVYLIKPLSNASITVG
jgi:PTH1 family peptidyl-tRNA hydrolase